MGSGSSKVVIKRETPDIRVNYKAVNDEVHDQATIQRGGTQKNVKQAESDSHVTKQTERDIHTIDIPSSTVEENQPESAKPVSETLQKTKDKLKALGSSLYEDPTLASHCDRTPALFTDFTRLHKYLHEIRKNIGKEDIATLISRPVSQISSLYSGERPDKIKKGNFIADVGFGEVCKEILVKLCAMYPTLLTYDRESDESENGDAESLEPLRNAQNLVASLMSMSINYTDLCDAVNLAFSEAGLIPVYVDIVEKTKDCTAHHIKYMDSSGKLSKKTVRGNILSRTLGTLHNLSKRVPTRSNFYACNAVKVVLPIIEDKVSLFATKSLLMLAYLIDESNNELIMANEGPIKFLITLIDRATKSSNKRYLGFSSAELAEGLAQIAINDANKKTIVAHGALPILAKMIKESSREDEEIAGVGALWVLAFDEDNREKMRQTEGLLDVLKSLQSSTNEEVQKAVSGALWEIEGKKNLSKSSADLQDSSSTRNHVMISYQWDVQKMLIQVKNRLQSAGFKVWMDLEQMGGSTLETMAKAVEDSAVVLVCVSQKYKESSNCRSEAEYAFQLKKDIVPLMMESNYKPDGWLGMIMGSKLWIDCSQGQRRLDTSIRDLERELGLRGKSGEEMIEVVVNDTVDAAPPPSLSPKMDISTWTNKDVINWIKGFGLELKKKNSLKRLNGPLLTRLHSLRIESPEFFYSSLKDDIGIYNVYNALLFTDELEKLVG